jgi:uncharacterized membrane protein SpoIIM required for sporulation
LASFVIIPMALLLQAESVVMFWGSFHTLWVVALGLVVVMLILIRMGVKTFNREEILGREIDELNLKRTVRLFRHFFVQPPGQAADPQQAWPAASLPLRLLRWVGRVYRQDLPYLLLHNWMPVAIVVFFLVVAACVGWAYVAKYPLPPGTLTLENLASQDLKSLSEVSFLPSLATGPIFTHNVQALLLAGLAAVISLGVLAVLMLMVSFTLIGFLAGQVALLGYSPAMFLAAFVLPHGLFEIPAAVIATAFALRIGVSITAPREGLTVGEGLVAAIADFAKVFLFLVVPLLLAAAFVEANLTPQIVIWAYGG